MINKNNEGIYRYIKSMETEISIEHVLDNNMSMSHSHNNYELYFLIDGSRRLLIQNNFYKMEKGDLLLIAPGVLHKTLNETPPEYKRIVINFPPKLLDAIAEKSTTYTDFLGKEAIIVRNSELFKSISNNVSHLETIAQENKTDPGAFEFLAASLLYKLIYFLMSENNILPNTKISEKNSNHISDILEYINENYTRTITLTELSTRFYISEFHLCRIFKKFTGRTIVEYINYLRIEKAKIILTTSDTSIKEVAKICGFKTTARFNHVFKEYERTNPSQFIKSRK